MIASISCKQTSLCLPDVSQVKSHACLRKRCAAESLAFRQSEICMGEKLCI